MTSITPKAVFSRLKKSRIFKDSASYTLLNIVEKAVPFVILPIVTRILTKDEVGLYVLYQAIIEILIPIMTLGIDSAILLNYYKLEKKDFSNYFSNGFYLSILSYMLIGLFIFSFSKQISTWISFPTLWFNIILILVAFRFVAQVRQNLWRVQYKIKHYGVFTIGLTLIKNVLGLILVAYTSLGWKGLVVGHIIGYGLFGVYALFTFYKENLILYTKKFAFTNDILKIGYPLSLHKFGAWLGNAANRVIISSTMGAAATGSYGIGATFSMGISLLVDSFNKAFMPILFEKLKVNSQNEKIKIVKLSYMVYAFLITSTFIVYIIGYFGVGLIFGKEYSDTKIFILPLLLAAMFNGFYKLHVNYIFFTKRTLQITKITFFTGVLNILLAFILIKNYGLIGAAYSLLIINIIQYIMAFHIGNKLIPMPWLKAVSIK